MAKQTRSWYAMKGAGAGVGDLRIFNDIGDFGVTAENFADDLDSLGDVSTLRIAISSNGGDVSQGFAIFNILERHSARKVVTIEGLAASMASVIAMVGDEVVMPANAMLMIHNPWGALMGEADQIKSFGEALEMMQDSIAESYVSRTGLDKTEVLSMMARETWLSAKKAVELGFADTVGNAMQVAASFDLRKFNHVPAKFAAQNARIDTMKKAPKNAVVESDSNDGAEGNVKTESQIRTEVLNHAREVRSLCNLAGMPKLAEGFIDKDLSLTEVIKALDAEKAKAVAPKPGSRAERTNGAELDAHNNGQASDGGPKAEVNPREIYSRWNKAGAKK